MNVFIDGSGTTEADNLVQVTNPLLAPLGNVNHTDVQSLAGCSRSRLRIEAPLRRMVTKRCRITSDEIRVHSGSYPIMVTKDNLIIREVDANANPVIDSAGVEFGPTV